VATRTSADGADAVVTTANGWSAWRTALRVARTNGRICVLGFPGRGEKPPEQNPLDPSLFYDKQLTIHAAGMTNGMSDDATTVLHGNMGWIVAELSAGKLPVEPLVTHEVTWDRLPEIYAMSSADRRAVIGGSLDWSSCRG
jgi:threonine dehydrogenase-like Zn-dependent dehydrogenase